MKFLTALILICAITVCGVSANDLIGNNIGERLGTVDPDERLGTVDPDERLGTVDPDERLGTVDPDERIFKFNL